MGFLDKGSKLGFLQGFDSRIGFLEGFLCVLGSPV